MKHLKYILPALLALFFLGSCYEDKGNYTYKDLNDVMVNVSGIEASYKVKVMEDLKITPKITPDGQEYEYYWGVYPVGLTDIRRMTIISHEKDLAYPVALQPGTYKLRFNAKNKTTGVFSYTEYGLQVETEIVKGWWLLKEKNGATEIDIHTNDKRLFADRIFTANQKTLDGAPVGMLYFSDWLRLDSVGEGANKRYTETKTKAVFVLSDKDVKVLDYYTTEIIGRFESLFRLNMPEVKKPQDIFFATSYISILNDDKLYSMRTLSGWIPASSFFSDNLLGDYKLAPQRATAPLWQPILFNQKNASFCTYSRVDNYMQYWKDGKFRVNNLDADVLFSKHRKMVAPSEWGYTLLKSRSKNEHYLYKMKSLNSGTGTSPVQKVDTLRQDKKMFHADKYAYSKGYDQTFFSIGNTIWSCEFATFNEKEQLAIPAGETITHIETLVTEAGAGEQPATYFTVATQVGARYKFYIYNVQAGNITNLVNLFEGEGKVKRAMFLDLRSTGTVYQTYLD